MSQFDIAVNLLWCVPGKVGGSEQYLTRQLAGLGAQPGLAEKFNVTLYTPRGFTPAHPELAAKFHIEETPGDGRNRAVRIYRENTWLARRSAGASLAHHGGGTIPFRTNPTTLLTVHDVQYLSYPEYFSADRLRYLTTMMPRSLRRATVVAVPSEYVRRTLIERFLLDAEKVHVVRHGIEQHGIETSETHVPASNIVSRHGLSNINYFIYPAMTHPHKNHLFLIDLLSGPWRASGHHLVFIGHEGRAHGELLTAIAASGCADRVHILGRVEGAERDALVGGATALVFPSKYEGFGAPLIEAMALGTPVVCSDTTSLPDVAGDAALVLPLVLDAWAQVPDQVRNEGDQLVQRGRARATLFTHEESGADLMRVYETVLKK